MEDKADLDVLNEMFIASDMPPISQEELDELEAEIARFEEETKDEPPVEVSDDFKREMNRIFRECGGIKKIPHPEVDNPFARFRSWVIVKFRLKPYDPSSKRRKLKKRRMQKGA